jgi:hypothetical protein
VDLTDITNAEYPKRLPFDTFGKYKIKAALGAAPADKAPEEDTIPNPDFHGPSSIHQSILLIAHLDNSWRFKQE